MIVTSCATRTRHDGELRPHVAAIVRKLLTPTSTYIRLTILALLLSGGAAKADEPLSDVGIDSIAVCYNFECKTRATISLSSAQWAEVAGWLSPPADNAADERDRIRRAVGWMEELAGRQTPTHRDVAGNLPAGAEMPGQLDCIDESRNTTTYLRLFEKNRLLRFHRVVERAYRRAIFDQHWAGQLETVNGGERFVVDSWFQDNGMLPYIQPTDDWKDIPLFTSYFDNSRKFENKVPEQKAPGAD